MPEDVNRSDSQRSDASATSRPRVSFNRDVHVKRIATGGAPRVVGALAADSAGRLHPLAVRRERPSRLSRRDIALEAKRVLDQADSVTCSSTARGLPSVVDTATSEPHKFSSLPTRRKKTRLVKQNNSFRESSPRVKEGTSSSSPERIPKRPRIVTRSASDAKDKRPDVDDKTRFWSLDRLRSKQSKERNRKVHSDTEASPKASILSRKSHSDTEKRLRKNSDSEASAAKKKQLSPIIEASPREDYFLDAGEEANDATDGHDVTTVQSHATNTSQQLMQDKVGLPRAPNRSRKTKLTQNEINRSTGMMNSGPVRMESILHSSQTISKPPLTRGLTVDSLVRKLSQDRAGRGPPRVVSPLSHGDDLRHHNNNLPFSYTEPPYTQHEDPRYTTLLSDHNNSFARGGGVYEKHSPTAHKDSISPTAGRPTSPALQGDGGQVIYAEVVCNGGGKAGGNMTKQTVHTSVAQSKLKEEATREMHSGGNREYKSELKTSLGDYSGAGEVEGRGRADGMDARKSMMEDEYRRASPTRRNLMEDFVNAESGPGYAGGYHEDFIEPILKPRSDLSLRRDRLESRIESQRKDRLMSSRLNDKSYRSHQNVNEAVVDNVRKYPSNPRLDSEYNRREFLDSQINYENGLAAVSRDKLYPGDTLGRSADNIGKLTDSGIDMNYRGESGPLIVNNYQTNEVVNETRRTYHNKYEKKQKPEKIRHSATPTPTPTLTNITKVDVNGHLKPGASDDDDQVDETPQYYYNSQQNVDQIKARQAALSATKLAHESKQNGLPQSAVLIRHLAPQDVTTGEGYRQERYVGSSRKKREFDERRDLEEDYRKTTLPGGLGNMEETRRFLVEERRRMVEERKGDDCWRPEKVMQKWSKMEFKTGKKKQGPIEKVKALFSGKKKAVKKTEATSSTPAAVDQLTSRYTEYKGGVGEETTPRAPSRSRNSGNQSQLEVSRRRERLATPSPSPSRPSTAPNNNNNNSNNSNNSWFKSLDRLTSRKKTKTQVDEGSVADETRPYKNNNNVDKGNKNLRFFGDTDAESVRSASRRPHPPLKPVSSLSTLQESSHGTQQRYVPLRDANSRRYKSTNKLQVPRRRHHRSAGELATSSAESTTEGDSSQQSQRSVVYLHAATVGDIPGRGPSRGPQRRARSREELSSTTGSNLSPQTRTVSRSISVLAPWKPRHYREPLEVHYENNSDLTSRGGKPPKVPTNYKTSSSTLNRIKNNKDASNKSYNSLSRDTRGKDKENLTRKSMNSLNRKENHKSIDSLRDVNGKGSRRDLDVTSYETSRSKRIGNGVNGSTTLRKTKTEDGVKRTDLARSVSMPKDSKVKSGWFRLRKK